MEIGDVKIEIVKDVGRITTTNKNARGTYLHIDKERKKQIR